MVGLEIWALLCCRFCKEKVPISAPKTIHPWIQSLGSDWFISISNCFSSWLLLLLVVPLSLHLIGSAADCIQPRPFDWWIINLALALIRSWMCVHQPLCFQHFAAALETEKESVLLQGGDSLECTHEVGSLCS